MRIKAIIVLAAILATACSGDNPKATSTRGTAAANGTSEAADGAGEADSPPPTPAAKTGVWQQAGIYRVRSLVPGISIIPIKDLPIVHYEGEQDQFCGTAFETPTTAEGKWARSRGWRVGEEGRLGGLTLVNVMRRYRYETQACGQVDGKILLFRDRRPMATISVGLPGTVDTLAIDQLIGQETGAVRLNNRLIAPFGDLVVTKGDIEIRPLPASDVVCRGKLKIPNIFDRPIQKVRLTLAAAGWRPAKTKPPVYTTNPDGSLTIEDHTQFGLYKEGITEVSGCAPTGFCDFEYVSKKARLTVSTMGETAVSYLYTCRG